MPEIFCQEIDLFIGVVADNFVNDKSGDNMITCTPDEVRTRFGYPVSFGAADMNTRGQAPGAVLRANKGIEAAGLYGEII